MIIRKKSHQASLIFGLAIFVIILSTIMMWKHNNSQPLAVINGEEILLSEYSLIQNHTESEIITYFRQKYKADIDKQFWNRNFSGEIPIELLKQKTMDKLIKLKMEQVLAKDKNIIADISYDAFIDAWNHENDTRENTSNNGKVVYGNTHFDEWGYYSYRQSNLVIELKKKLTENELEQSTNYDSWIEQKIQNAKVKINADRIHRIKKE